MDLANESLEHCNSIHKKQIILKFHRKKGVVLAKTFSEHTPTFPIC